MPCNITESGSPVNGFFRLTMNVGKFILMTDQE
jgi:hypothetical protein